MVYEQFLNVRNTEVSYNKIPLTRGFDLQHLGFHVGPKGVSMFMEMGSSGQDLHCQFLSSSARSGFTKFTCLVF